MAATKRCNNCGEVKPLEDFFRRAASGDGRQHRCKECQSKSGRWTGDRAKAAERAWSAARYRAFARLRDAHPDEYEAYFREERRGE